VYANHQYGEGVMTGAGGYEEAPYGPAMQPQPDSESQPVSDVDPSSEQADAGLLMSFLTDFRTAEYEEVRRKRMEELEKSKKGRAHRPVPPPEDAEHDVDPSPDDGYEQAQWGPTEVQPGAHDPASAPSDGSYPVDDPDFQVAACQPEEPSGRRRFPLGLPSLKGFGQSPATA
jgi:hypothetical protein